ncbi:PfkB family carbohydrate kinase [Paracoccus aerius]
MTLDLIAVGDNCLDVYLSKGHMAVGGNALNVAVQWRRLGLAARYLGVVGKDAEGDIILAALGQAGLDPADVERRDGSTAVTLLQEQGATGASCSRIWASAWAMSRNPGASP